MPQSSIPRLSFALGMLQETSNPHPHKTFNAETAPCKISQPSRSTPERHEYRCPRPLFPKRRRKYGQCPCDAHQDISVAEFETRSPKAVRIAHESSRDARRTHLQSAGHANMCHELAKASRTRTVGEARSLCAQNIPNDMITLNVTRRVSTQFRKHLPNRSTS